MASLQSRISDLITAIGTDYKFLRNMITGSSNGDLTGLTTTAKSSVVAAINEVKAGNTGSPPDASETVKGIAELATQTETNAGTDDARIVTPLKFQTRLAAYAMPASYLDTSTALGTSDVKVPSQNAVKVYADALIGANDAMVFKGVQDCSTNPNYPAANRGDTYKVSVAGKIGGASGTNVEIGDTLICITDGTASGTQAAVGANWNIIQANLDGAVIGPASAVSGQLVAFSGTTGKLVSDSGLAIDTDVALTANSDTKIPSQKAVKAYAQPLDADLTAIAAVASQTAYGRSLLTVVDGPALAGLLPASSETVASKIEIATQAEVTTGTDDLRAITPLKLASSDTTKFGNPDTDLVALYTAAKV